MIIYLNNFWIVLYVGVHVVERTSNEFKFIDLLEIIFLVGFWYWYEIINKTTESINNCNNKLWHTLVAESVMIIPYVTYSHLFLKHYFYGSYSHK